MNAPAQLANESTRAIGAILVDAGRLNLADAESILRLQREKGMRFGDAAKELKLLSEEDVQFALARQFAYPYLLQGESPVLEEVVAAYEPFTPAVEALRGLRSQLMMRWFDTEVERHTLAIVSPESKEGRSWLAANLAVVFSQLGERTLLIDANLRRPRQHRLFGLENKSGLSAVLSGRGGPEVIERVSTLRDLSVMPAGAIPPNPSELLSRPMFSKLLAHLAKEFDVILLDTPAGYGSADAQLISVRAGGALLVARKNYSRASRLQSLSDAVVQAGSVLVGSVVNEF